MTEEDIRHEILNLCDDKQTYETSAKVEISSVFFVHLICCILIISDYLFIITYFRPIQMGVNKRIRKELGFSKCTQFDNVISRFIPGES